MTKVEAEESLSKCALELEILKIEASGIAELIQWAVDGNSVLADSDGLYLISDIAFKHGEALSNLFDRIQVMRGVPVENKD